MNLLIFFGNIIRFLEVWIVKMFHYILMSVFLLYFLPIQIVICLSVSIQIFIFFLEIQSNILYPSVSVIFFFSLLELLLLLFLIFFYFFQKNYYFLYFKNCCFDYYYYYYYYYYYNHWYYYYYYLNLSLLIFLFNLSIFTELY